MAELEEIRQRRAAAWERAQEVGSGGNWRSHTEEVEDFTWKSASFRKLKCFFSGFFMDFRGLTWFNHLHMSRNTDKNGGFNTQFAGKKAANQESTKCWPSQEKSRTFAN
jgi:hypothetical protein